ncbi:MAG: PucR family transcriptional regulator [Actinobacteria bacterium]|nr:PucR family transcriptional regulator [Actinomycetota bacterium]
MSAHAPQSAAPATIELGTLLRQYQLGLVLIAGAHAASNGADAGELPVQWVHSSDMADPTPFLTPRTVLLTTGNQFSEEPSGVEAEAYLHRLLEAGVTALGFGVGILWDRIPPALVATSERLGLPLFRVPYATPFIAIAQTAVQLIGAHSRARDAWALEAQRAVASAATQRDGLAAVVREAAARLGRWVGVADRTGRIIEFAPRSARAELGAEWIRRETRELIERGTRASRVRSAEGGGSGAAGSGTPDSAAPAVELQTLGRSGQLLGVLLTPAVVQDHAERTLLGLVAALASVQLEHRAGQGGAETALRASVLQLLLAGEAELAERIAAGILPRMPRGRIRVVRLPRIEAVEQDLIDDLRSLATRPGLLTAPLEDGAVLVCEGSQAEAVRRALAEHRTPAGISELGGLDALASLLEQADVALHSAVSIRGSGPAGAAHPVDYRPSMHGGVLRLLDGPEARRLAEGLLAPVRLHDQRHGDAIEQSLTVWLAHHGQTSPAAAELGVHRHTMRSRVQTAATLLQRDLDDADTRAELWAALRISAGRAAAG